MYQSLVLFRPGFFERIWGGNKLRDTLGMEAPSGKAIGEAWLVSDHENFTSEVLDGPWAGQSLHDLLCNYPDYLLGTTARPTVHGRFPLLLKVLDAADTLSVQVHPDDGAAAALDEPDGGKTEMWHVIESGPDSTLICGLDPALDAETFRRAGENGSIAQYMPRIPAPPGTTAFVSAGTVHAIGAQILLAEIQQNSDLTYRIHDWNRVDDSGTPRALHLDKAARVTKFGNAHGGAAKPLEYAAEGGPITVLGACRYFASELVAVDGSRTRRTNGRSFHLLMPRDGSIEVSSGAESRALRRCQAALIPAGADHYTLTGSGIVLDYYVPDLALDIIAPLQSAGHEPLAIAELGGAPSTSDLAIAIQG